VLTKAQVGRLTPYEQTFYRNQFFQYVGFRPDNGVATFTSEQEQAISTISTIINSSVELEAQRTDPTIATNDFSCPTEFVWIKPPNTKTVSKRDAVFLTPMVWDSTILSQLGFTPSSYQTDTKFNPDSVKVDSTLAAPAPPDSSSYFLPLMALVAVGLFFYSQR
jgi:hypothetical protein